MKALVTGGAGFIGSHLVDQLLADGHEVIVLDSLRTGRAENLKAAVGCIRFVQGDIRDASLVSQLTQGCDWVFHQAAIVSVPYSIEHPQESHDVNIQGTLNVLLAARDARVKRVVFASSAAIYGDEPTLPKHEQMRPTPIAPYGIEKLTAEYYLSVFHRLYGVPTVALRYFNVFGPRQDPSSAYSGVISIFAQKLHTAQDPTIFGDGEQTRDFVYVRDVVQANMRAARTDEAVGHVFNVGRGEQTTLNQLLQTMAKLCGKSARATHQPARDGDIRYSLADIALAKDLLGYQPDVAVEEGLRRLLAA